LSQILITDGPTVSPDTLLGDMFELTSSAKVPVSVVDENGKLLGVIIRGALLGALAGDVNMKEGNANDTENSTR
jgi:glycine betaine/proline transport system ATP-binding protein